MPLTDDEAIATAMLHGCGFARGKGQTILWYVVSAHGDVNPIEDLNYQITGGYGFKSREALARAYCKFHNLEG